MANVHLSSGCNLCKGAWFFYCMVVIMAVSFLALVHISDVTGQTKWIKYLKNPVLDKSSSGWDEQLLAYHYVLLDGNEFKMWYTAFGSVSPGGICCAVSTDGINWTRHPGNPVLGPGSAGTIEPAPKF